jgi:hypothetical protein
MHIFLLLFLLLSITACGSNPPKHLKIGTGSRIDVLGANTVFYQNHMPLGWVIEGADAKDIFDSTNHIPNISMVRKDALQGVHIQSGSEDFILARYLQAQMLVSPYLTWRWYVSEHKSQHHPVRLVVGFYGGDAQSPPLQADQMVWRGENLPPFDRILAIGFDNYGLKRGNIYNMGKVKYYVQRGGIEQTNQWHFEAVDLSMLYKRAWPQDQTGNVIITFIGMSAQSNINVGGATFTTIQLSR